MKDWKEYETLFKMWKIWTFQVLWVHLECEEMEKNISKIETNQISIEKNYLLNADIFVITQSI